MADGCVFCSIVSGTIPADVVFEDDRSVAFLDSRPLFPGHVLVVPRPHLETIADLPDDGVGPFFSVVRAMATAVETALDAEGIFIAQNNVVSQSVPHIHVHVVPRRFGDGLRGFFWPRTGYDDDAHRVSVADRIRSAAAH